MPPGQTVKILARSSIPDNRLITMKPFNAVLFAALSLACVAVAEDPRNVEIRLTRAMDELNKRDTVNIYGDMITLEKVHVDDEEERSARKGEDPLIGQIERFLNSRRIRVRLPNDGSSADMFGRALGRKDMGVELRALITGASEGENYFLGFEQGN